MRKGEHAVEIDFDRRGDGAGRSCGTGRQRPAQLRLALRQRGAPIRPSASAPSTPRIDTCTSVSSPVVSDRRDDDAASPPAVAVARRTRGGWHCGLARCETWTILMLPATRIARPQAKARMSRLRRLPATRAGSSVGQQGVRRVEHDLATPLGVRHASSSTSARWWSMPAMWRRPGEHRHGVAGAVADDDLERRARRCAARCASRFTSPPTRTRVAAVHLARWPSASRPAKRSCRRSQSRSLMEAVRAPLQVSQSHCHPTRICRTASSLSAVTSTTTSSPVRSRVSPRGTITRCSAHARRRPSRHGERRGRRSPCRPAGEPSASVTSASLRLAALEREEADERADRDGLLHERR